MDPTKEMELEQKREIVEREKKLQKDRKKFEKAVKSTLPKNARKGNVLPLKLYPDEALSTPCEEVERFDSELRDLVNDMAMTMYMCGGVGLAANQVGVLKRLFVCDIRSNLNGPSEFRVFINPVVVSVGGGWEKLREGCLSFPGVREPIKRPAEVSIRAFTHKGRAFDTTLTAWPARVFLHEFDHLDGKTWLDLMGTVQRKYALRKLKKVDRGLELEQRQVEKKKR